MIYRAKFLAVVEIWENNGYFRVVFPDRKILGNQLSTLGNQGISTIYIELNEIHLK